MFDHDDDTRRPRAPDPPFPTLAPLGAAGEPVRVRFEVDVPPDTAGLILQLAFAAEGADGGGLAAAVKALVASCREAAARERATNDRIDRLAGEFVEFRAKVRAGATNPPESEANPGEFGEHRGNPWGDESPRDVM